MKRHIFFIAPELTAPTGGLNVIYQFAAILRTLEFDCSVHFSSPHHQYPYSDELVDLTYSSRKSGLRQSLSSVKSLLKGRRALSEITSSRGPNRRQTPSDKDLLVFPEVGYHRVPAELRALPHMVLVQDVQFALHAVFGPRAAGMEFPGSLVGFVSTSQAAHALVSQFSRHPHWYVPLFVDPNSFSYRERKSRTVCYMPRKRKEEAELLVQLLTADGALQDFSISSISNLPAHQLKQSMRDALVFLSFSQREGFGLPPAEAMASGCITVGYAGVGGREYLTPDVSFPVPEDDTLTFYQTVVAVLDEYRRAPERLDAMRRNASAKILSTYTRERTSRALLKVFEEVAK